MKIQVISLNREVVYNGEHEYTYSSLNDPVSFDAFDLNIISLQTPDLWIYQQSSISSINEINDFKSLRPLIQGAKKSQVIIAFPQNYTYKYYYLNGRYTSSRQLKDMLGSLQDILKVILPPGLVFGLTYENSTTLCKNTKFNSAFYFENYAEENQILSVCQGGEHKTTFYAMPNLILTTLDISNAKTEIDSFLEHIKLLNKNIEYPSWIGDYKFWNDDIQKDIIFQAKQEISKQEEIISKAQAALDDNLRYKSILCETGDGLVKVVFEMLEKMLNYSLSDFVDKKQEDFRIKLSNVTFIGEIKGITSNVKSEHVSQLDVHIQIYHDELFAQGKQENIKGILIVNSQRNKPLSDRDEVHEMQIMLAKRNGTLIITTETLLILYVAYLENNITTGEIIEILTNKVGLLSYIDFIKS